MVRILPCGTLGERPRLTLPGGRSTARSQPGRCEWVSPSDEPHRHPAADGVHEPEARRGQDVRDPDAVLPDLAAREQLGSEHSREEAHLDRRRHALAAELADDVPDGEFGDLAVLVPEEAEPGSTMAFGPATRPARETDR